MAWRCLRNNQHRPDEIHTVTSGEKVGEEVSAPDSTTRVYADKGSGYQERARSRPAPCRSEQLYGRIGRIDASNAPVANRQQPDRPFIKFDLFHVIYAR
jgi:hypothetical protein